MAQTLFKYTDAKTAELILQNRSRRWNAPERFNDPFEFKSPMEFSFEWEDLELHLVEEFTRLVTQSIEPELVEGGPTTQEIREFRTEYKESRPDMNHVQAVFRQPAAILTRMQKEKDLDAREFWQRMKREYRVICLSALPDNILMWSHYSESHKGIAFGFKPQSASSWLFAAKPVLYSKQVPSAASLEDFVAFLTSQRPQPRNEMAFQNAVFTKNLDWSYEQEWRVLAKDTTAGDELHSDWPFDPAELVSIYFGCRMDRESKDRIIAAARKLGTSISFFDMQDERIRFELTPLPLKS
jgi:Protein of unknown function (DUF2971)